jgi:hypothetical protein
MAGELGAILFIGFWAVLLFFLGKSVIDSQKIMAKRTEYIGKIADALDRIATSLEKKKK